MKIDSIFWLTLAPRVSRRAKAKGQSSNHHPARFSLFRRKQEVVMVPSFFCFRCCTNARTTLINLPCPMDIVHIRVASSLTKVTQDRIWCCFDETS